MGTRNLTMVIDRSGNTKIAQYGQWDGYPEGQGSTILKFLNKRKSNNFENFQKKLGLIHFETENEILDVKKFVIDLTGSDSGWMTQKQSEEFNKKYPLISRDLGGDILNEVCHLTKPAFLTDSTDFVADGLFCEWAYVIDFKKNTFEVYKGFNKEKLTENDRFYYLNDKSEGEYFPAVLQKEYKLDQLPTLKQFLTDFKNPDD